MSDSFKELIWGISDVPEFEKLKGSACPLTGGREVRELIKERENVNYETD